MFHFNCWCVACLISGIGLATAGMTRGWAQDNSPQTLTGPLANRVVDYSEWILVASNLGRVRDDCRRLLKDSGVGGGLEDIVDNALKLPDGLETAVEPEVIAYGDVFYPMVIQLHATDRERLGGWMRPKDEAPIEPGTPFNFSKWPVPMVVSPMTLGTGVFHGGRWLGFTKAEAVESFLSAPMLAEQLDMTSQDIINRYGISCIVRGESIQIDRLYDLDPLRDDLGQDLTPGESAWLDEFSAIIRSAHTDVVGLQYHQRSLEIRSRLGVGASQSFGNLVDAQRDAASWQPDLGLEEDGLLIGGAIQLEAFRSSAASRLIPQVVLQEIGRTEHLRWLQGSMLRILAELVGDSWNDLRAARVGLYRNDAPTDQGHLAVLGIADAREAAIVLRELRRLSVLASPDDDPGDAPQREQEIHQLIRELASEDPNIVARAQTRLLLAGDSALPALRILQERGDDATQQRARVIIRRIERRQGVDRDRFAVADPNFWTTLNPGLEFVESTPDNDGVARHVVRITPDPSKSPEEVAEAIDAMKYAFGPNWDTISIAQVGEHFLFMIGSNDELFKRSIANLQQQRRAITEIYESAEWEQPQGQLHLFASAARLAELNGLNSQLLNLPQPEQFHTTWLALQFEPHYLDARLILPTSEWWGISALRF